MGGKSRQIKLAAMILGCPIHPDFNWVVWPAILAVGKLGSGRNGLAEADRFRWFWRVLARGGGASPVAVNCFGCGCWLLVCRVVGFRFGFAVIKNIFLSLTLGTGRRRVSRLKLDQT